MCLSLSKEKTIPGDSSRRLNNATDGRIIIKKSCECDKHIYGSMWTNARVLYIGHQGRCRRRPINYNIFSRLSRSATAAKKKKILGPAAQYYYRFCGDSNSKLIISSTMMVMMMKLGTEHFPIPAVELILCAF